MRSFRRHSRRAAQAGVTLIELLMVLALLGVMMAVGYSVLRDVSKAALREDATEVTAVLRAAHNMSTMTRKHHRVVFDLEKQMYQIEVCEKGLKLRKRDREAEPMDPADLEALANPEQIFQSSNLPPEVVKSIAGEEPAKLAAAIKGTEIPGQCQPATTSADDAEGKGNIRRIRTDDGVRIRRIHVQHLEGAQLEGVVTINFFPLGQAEKAVVEIGHEDGGQFTVVVHGLTGRVELEVGEIDVDEHMFRDGAGDDVEERE